MALALSDNLRPEDDDRTRALEKRFQSGDERGTRLPRPAQPHEGGEADIRIGYRHLAAEHRRKADRLGSDQADSIPADVLNTAGNRREIARLRAMGARQHLYGNLDILGIPLFPPPFRL